MALSTYSTKAPTWQRREHNNRQHYWILTGQDARRSNIDTLGGEEETVTTAESSWSEAWLLLSVWSAADTCLLLRYSLLPSQHLHTHTHPQFCCPAIPDSRTCHLLYSSSSLDFDHKVSAHTYSYTYTYTHTYSYTLFICSLLDFDSSLWCPVVHV